ncbi:MAG: nicotinamide mononucleotide transporter [Nocardioidaceae bacterium]|nr:nicotinamide mononucleotide transporter [Nocardioidaceae bacterium]
MNPLEWLLEGSWVIAGSPILVREVVGNGFGLASALLGMRRVTWAWPVGMVGNVLLFSVFVGGMFAKPQEHDLWGQAARQVFFFGVSAYGWSRWQRSEQAGGADDGGAITPRWATARELRQLIVAGALMMGVFVYALQRLGSWGPVADAWILTGSILATYGMARGYVEFWWIWIGVDAVGVPLLLKAGYYPSAVLYLLYGGFCLLGFLTWSRAERRLPRDRQTDIPGSRAEVSHV